jgi:DNA-binding response OmpR family regulator
VTIDRARHVISAAGEPIRLSALQYSVFEQLIIHAGGVVEHGWVAEALMGCSMRPVLGPSALTRLRRIFRDHLVIESVRGSGYLMGATSQARSNTRTT